MIIIQVEPIDGAEELIACAPDTRQLRVHGSLVVGDIHELNHRGDWAIPDHRRALRRRLLSCRDCAGSAEARFD
jgi:hypothetical protein